MAKDCEKYIKKAKKGALIFSTIFIIMVLKKSSILDSYDIDVFLFIWILSAGIIGMKLYMPYVFCLSQYKRK